MQKRVTKEEWIGSEEFFTTTYLTIDLIRKWCKENKWYDAWKAIDLYLFYAKCSNIQETRTIYCTREFASKWLWYSIDTITKYKKALENIWCITQICKKSEDWKVEWRYISIKLATSRVLEPEEVWTHYWFNTPPNTVVNKDLNTELNKEKNNTSFSSDNSNSINEKFNSAWTSFPHARWSHKARSLANFKKKLEEWFDVDIMILILKWKIASWICDQKFLPAFERRVRDLVPIDIENELRNICSKIRTLQDSDMNVKLKNDFEWIYDVKSEYRRLQEIDDKKNRFGV